MGARSEPRWSECRRRSKTSFPTPSITAGLNFQTIAAAAKVELFELRNLRVGKTAPDIEGEDLDGKKFKLSDYKGKVVVLDFWGDW